ncbi:MAG: hypothetical protein JRN16_02915 [Nitrososphaerota archaeon]|nr:hypothetical protein [Nitrososphaerota archaeon]MDG6968599.1 hypothetical protein [Nitrososphaerota archaeon]MDG6974625.1 hypothetical protein [Nitrososphaerota archaeon]MDG7019853.1 hypothetical protein [Nitrososphaerota archaeon]MDG7027343.1 hypothetical protein [Nitrososphaerota archaeon]
MAKRYVLFAAEDDLTEGDLTALSESLEKEYGHVRVIAVPGRPRAVIVRTLQKCVPSLRDPATSPRAGGKSLTALSTSGAVGNLKRRAKEAASYGQVHER